MSRALRRQPLVRKPPAKSAGFRPSGAQRPQKQQPNAPEVKARRTFIERIPVIGGPAQDIVNELKKVSWPSREETTRLTVAVIAVTVTIGLLLGGVDMGFNWVADNTLLR